MKTTNISFKIEPHIKEQAEEILNQIGMSMSGAFGLFMRQLIIQRKIPFELKASDYEPPIFLDKLSKEEFDALMEKSLKDIEEGRVISSEELNKRLKRDLGIWVIA